MRNFNAILILSLMLILTLLSSCSKPKAAVEETVAAPEVKVLAGELLAELTKIDTAMATQITAHANKFANEAEIRELLKATATVHPAIKTSCYVDTKGILKYLEPEQYKASEGADISKQAHTIAMLKDPKPVMSTSFQAVEGFPAVILAHPLYTVKQKFTGSLVLTIDTSLLPKIVMDKQSVPANFELWAMETDGMTVCDQDKEEIGLNIFTDPLYQPYESLRNLARTISNSPTGNGEYSFKAAGSETVVHKKATWDTITMHGRDWRVILVQKD